MKTFQAFFKKELMESWRRFKLPLLLILFIFLGLLNPFTALLTPEILDLVMEDGLILQLPEPTSLDSWIQFYKNIPQLGLIVFILVYSTIVNREIGEHTLVNIVTKGARRGRIVLAKFIHLLLQWTLYLFISLIITWGYTRYYFQDDFSQNILEGAFLLWIFGVVIISLLLLGSTITKNNYGGLLFVGGIFISLTLWNFFDYHIEWNPMQLATENINLISGDLQWDHFYKSIATGILLCIAALMGSIYSFGKKKL